MTCLYQLPPGFYSNHPETTCQGRLSPNRLKHGSDTEWATPQDWYDRNIARILDHLPHDPPSQQHHDQAVYWLSKAALKCLINVHYAGEITLEDFVLFRDAIREWEEAHRMRTFKMDAIDVTHYPSPRIWAAQLVQQAIRSARGE